MKYLPTFPQITKETIAVLCATIVAAYIISRFPPVQKFVKDNSITLGL